MILINGFTLVWRYRVKTVPSSHQVHADRTLVRQTCTSLKSGRKLRTQSGGGQRGGGQKGGVGDRGVRDRGWGTGGEGNLLGRQNSQNHLIRSIFISQWMNHFKFTFWFSSFFLTIPFFLSFSKRFISSYSLVFSSLETYDLPALPSV